MKIIYFELRYLTLTLIRRGGYRYQIFDTGDTEVRSEKSDTSEKYRALDTCTRFVIRQTTNR